MHTTIHKKIKGFTILESLVSISILAIAVTGPLVYVTNSLQAAEVARDQTIAFFLAQDAVEHVKNIRDDNGLTRPRVDWLYGLDACFDDEGCRFDRTTVPIPVVCSGGCGVLRKAGESESFIGYSYSTSSGWEDTSFVRTIEMEDIIPGEEARVTVTVSWTTKGNARQVVVVEHIFNWHNAPTYGV